MNTQHTPGPWHVQPDPEWAGKHPFHDHRFITCGPNADMTSDEWHFDPNCYIIASMRDCQNQEANARLIAAAPELKARLAPFARLNVETCSRCDGSGSRADGGVNEACGQCGGLGRVVTGFPDANEVEAARALLARLEGGE